MNCSDNNNVNVEYLQCPRVHVKPRLRFDRSLLLSPFAQIQTRRGECSLKNIIVSSSFRFVSFRSTNDLSICSGRQYCRSQSVGQHQLLRFIARNDRFEYRTGRGKTLLNACFSLHVFVSHLSEYSRIEITGWIRSIKSRKFGCAGKKSLFRTLSYSRTTRNISIGQFTRSRDR